MSLAIGRCWSDPIDIHLSLRPSAHTPTPVFTTKPDLLPSPCPSAGGGGRERAEFPNQGSFVFFLPVRDKCCSHSSQRPLPHPSSSPSPGSAPVGRGRDENAHDQGRGELRGSTVSRIQSPVASELGQGHVDPLELGPRRTLEAQRPSPGGPRHLPPMRQDQALGCAVAVLVCPPQFPAGVGNSLPGGWPGYALSVCRNKRLVCLGRCSCCPLGERLEQGPSGQ